MGLIDKVPSKPSGDVGKTWPAIAMGFFVAFGGILFGLVDWQSATHNDNF